MPSFCSESHKCHGKEKNSLALVMLNSRYSLQGQRIQNYYGPERQRHSRGCKATKSGLLPYFLSPFEAKL